MGLTRFTSQGFAKIKQDDTYSTWHMKNIQLLININETVIISLTWLQGH